MLRIRGRIYCGKESGKEDEEIKKENAKETQILGECEEIKKENATKKKKHEKHSGDQRILYYLVRFALLCLILSFLLFQKFV